MWELRGVFTSTHFTATCQKVAKDIYNDSKFYDALDCALNSVKNMAYMQWFC